MCVCVYIYIYIYIYVCVYIYIYICNHENMPSWLSPFIYNDGTILRTGITCKKIPSYMCYSTCRWFIVKKATIF